jgi:DNA-binding NtrC family response regulator
VILLVDDDEGVRYALARILRNAGYEVKEAGDGTEALALLQKSYFDLVITDVRMPAESGLVLATHIHVKWPDKPVILMSGYLSEDAGKYISQGLAVFIHKPVHPSILIAQVKRLLNPSLGHSSILWRKSYDSTVWHHCSNCSTWPTSDYEERNTIAPDNEVCNECEARELANDCR